MLFFLARSTLCIGLVAAAASGVGTRPLATAVARNAADGFGRACLASEGCLRAGAAALAAVAEGPRPVGGMSAVPASSDSASKTHRRAVATGG